MDLSSRACLIVHKLNIPVKAKKKMQGKQRSGLCWLEEEEK